MEKHCCEVLRSPSTLERFSLIILTVQVTVSLLIRYNFLVSACANLYLADLYSYRPIHCVKFLAFHGDQLEYNGSQDENEARKSARI